MEQNVGVTTMHKPLKIRLTDLNPHLTCVICHGYFVNATTITECLHSFCRSCIVQYLESHKYCPICEVQIHKTKPLLNLRSDQTLQDIVYKLVPGLFQNEMQRRKSYYASNPSVVKPVDPEQSGELSERSYIYTSDEYISLSLEYFNASNNNNDSTTKQSRRYLRCPAAVSILHLQKLIRAKYGLSKEHKVEILYQNDSLCEHFTLIDVAYIYLWKRKGPLHLTYRIFETECQKKMKLSNEFQCDIEISAQSIDLVATRNETENNQNQSNKVNNVNNISNSDECSNRKDDGISNALCHNNNNNVIGFNKSYDKVNKNESSKVHDNSDKEVQLQISETGIISVTSMAVTLQAPYNETVSTVLATVTGNVASVTPTLTTEKSSCCVSSSVLTAPDQSATKPVSTTKSIRRNSATKSNQASNDRKRKADDDAAIAGNPIKKSASQVPCSLPQTIKSSQNINTSTNITTTTSTAMLKPTKLALTPSSKSVTPTSFSTPLPLPPVSSTESITRPTSSSPGKTTVRPPPLCKPKSVFSGKKTSVLGYKTLRNPPKSWNPTVQRSRSSSSPPYTNYLDQKPSNSAPSIISSTTTVTTSSTTPIVSTKSKPNKFFKVRNNIPRYLGNPASGVKPMYQISPGPPSSPDPKKKTKPIKPESSNSTVEPNKSEVNEKTVPPSNKDDPQPRVVETIKEDSDKVKNEEKITVSTPRTNLKVPLGNRSSPMTVSEMLQLRNSPKVTPKSDTVETKSSKEESVEKSVKPESNEPSKQVESKDEGTKVGKEPELKISQTTVPIYSPRLKPKPESKFQKPSLSLNLKIDVQNLESPLEISQSKYAFNSFQMPLFDRKSPKQKSRNSPKPSTPANSFTSPKKNSQPSPNFMFDSKAQLEQMLEQNQQLKLPSSLGKFTVPITKNYPSVSMKHPTKSEKLSVSTDKSVLPKGSLAVTSAPLSPKLPDLSLGNQKFNFMSNHFLNPGQFLYPNYAAALSSYDPRLHDIHNLTAYQCINSFLLNQHRFSFPPQMRPSTTTACNTLTTTSLPVSSSSVSTSGTAIATTPASVTVSTSSSSTRTTNKDSDHLTEKK